MALPLTPTRSGDQGLDDIRAQEQGKLLAGFGRVTPVPLTSLELTTDTVGSLLSAPSTAVLRVCLLGDTMLLGLDTYARLTLSAGCTQLKIRLPFGLHGTSRTPLSGGPESRQGIARCLIIDPVAGFVNGFLSVEDTFLKVARDASAAFGAGTATLGVYGQIWAEVIRPDEA